MDPVGAVLHALSISFAMTWEILWALILGFMLSAVRVSLSPPPASELWLMNSGA